MNGWERWLSAAGSLASLAALGYLVLHLPKRGERVTVAGLRGLPAHGRIPTRTVKRALKKLPKKSQACRGMTVSALREGMEIEREHRDVTKGAIGTTAKIAAAHICERPDYYKRIKKYVER